MTLNVQTVNYKHAETVAQLSALCYNQYCIFMGRRTYAIFIVQNDGICMACLSPRDRSKKRAAKWRKNRLFQTQQKRKMNTGNSLFSADLSLSILCSRWLCFLYSGSSFGMGRFRERHTVIGITTILPWVMQLCSCSLTEHITPIFSDTAGFGR